MHSLPGLTVALKSCQSPKFMFISFFSSSMLHWDRTLPLTFAWKWKTFVFQSQVPGFLLSCEVVSLTFLMVAVYCPIMLWSMPSICCTRSQTASVVMELRRTGGVADATEAEPWTQIYFPGKNIQHFLDFNNKCHYFQMWHPAVRWIETSSKSWQVKVSTWA